MSSVSPPFRDPSLCSSPNVGRCYEEMTDQDVKGGQLIWDESEQGCGKGQSHQFLYAG
jgi:hypothetical protein